MLSRFVELEEKPPTDEDLEWDAFVADHPHGSLLQTTAWARLKARFGWSAERVWLRKDGKLVAGAQILFRSVAFGIVRMGYIPHGPLVDWGDEDQVDVLFNQIDLAAFRSRAGILKYEPLVWEDAFGAEAWQALCARHGSVIATDSIQPPRTVVVDLTASEDEILERMKQKTRYNIRLAERKGVTVRRGIVDDLPAFAEMMQLTGQRNRIGVHVPRYYQDAYERFAPDNVGLFVAEYEDVPLAGVMAFTLGQQAAYLYGASNNKERQRMPSYAVQWEAMRWAKRRGCTSYDLWGVPDHNEADLESGFMDRSDGLWGVYRFKRGFGGEVRRTVGSVDRVYNKMLYRLYQWRRRRNEATPETAAGEGDD